MGFQAFDEASHPSEAQRLLSRLTAPSVSYTPSLSMPNISLASSHGFGLSNNVTTSLGNLTIHETNINECQSNTKDMAHIHAIFAMGLVNQRAIFELAQELQCYNFQSCSESTGVFVFYDTRDAERFLMKISSNYGLYGNTQATPYYGYPLDLVVFQIPCETLRSTNIGSLKTALSTFGEISILTLDSNKVLRCQIEDGNELVVCKYYDMRATMAAFKVGVICLNGFTSLTLSHLAASPTMLKSLCPFDGVGQSMRDLIQFRLQSPQVSCKPQSFKFKGNRALDPAKEPFKPHSKPRLNSFEVAPAKSNRSSYLSTQSVSTVESLTSDSSVGSASPRSSLKDTDQLNEVAEIFKKFDTNRPKKITEYSVVNSNTEKCNVPRLAHRSEHLEDMNRSETRINLEGITEGIENRCTVMVRNIPNRLSFDQFKEFMDSTCKNQYAFLYLRFDFTNRCNVGYAFVTFTHPKYVGDFVKKREGMSWKKMRYNSDKVIEIRYARHQGLESLCAKFRTSPVMAQEHSFRPHFYHTKGPNKGAEIEFMCENLK